MNFVLTIVLLLAGADARLANAVKAGDKAAVQALLQQRIDVNAPKAMDDGVALGSPFRMTRNSSTA